MTRRVNVDRMRRYRERTRSGPTCVVCRLLEQEARAVEPNTSAAYDVGSRAFGHYVNAHYLPGKGLPGIYPHITPVDTDTLSRA